MKFSVTVVSLLVFVSSPLLQADEITHLKAAEDLLQAARVDQMMAKMQVQQKESIEKMMATFMPKSLAPDKMAAMQEMQMKVFDYVFQEMSWAKLKPDFVQVYVEVFTEEEMRGLIAFYQTPLGEKLLEKTPQVTARTMEITQKRVMAMMPQIQKMAVDSMQAAKPAAEPKVE